MLYICCVYSQSSGNIFPISAVEDRTHTTVKIDVVLHGFETIIVRTFQRNNRCVVTYTISLYIEYYFTVIF